MALLDLRRRNGLLFGVLTLAHLLLISAQVTTRSGLPLPAQAAFEAFSGVQAVASAAVQGIGGVWREYVALRQVRAHNARLQDDVARLQVQLQRQQALASRAAGLEALLRLREASEFSTLAASVVGGSSSPEFRTLTIDRGRADALEPDLAVLAPAGVVGRVIRTARNAARIQLLVDRNAAAGVLVERSRAQGVAMGTGSGLLRLDFVAGSADVAVGDRVLTSGIDGIYPKGLLVGTVADVSREGGTLGEVRIRPAVDFGRLEDVLVVTTRPAPVSPEEGP